MDQDQLKELRELIEFLKSNEIAEFDMEQPDFKVRLKFAGAAPPAGVDLGQLSQMLASRSASEQTAFAPAANLAASAAEPLAAVTPSVIEETLHSIKSPIVGTFYDSPSPGAPAFVKPGDEVEVGQVLCIIEAMKLMNEIESDVAGEVVKRIATSGQPIEYGQPLFSIRPR